MLLATVRLHSTSARVMLMHSWILARTAATAELGGPLPGSSDPIASQVVFTQDLSGVPRAACSQVLSHRICGLRCRVFPKLLDQVQSPDARRSIAQAADCHVVSDFLLGERYRTSRWLGPYDLFGEAEAATLQLRLCIIADL